MILASEGEPCIGRFSVSTTPQPLELPGPRKNSQGVLIKVLGDNSAVYVGVNRNVSPSTGFPVYSGNEFSLNIRETEKLWVVAEEATEVAYMAL